MTRYKTKKKEFTDLITKLKNVPCADCGQMFPTACMDFDHANGNKRFNIGKGWSYSLKSILEEIDKCEVVCANCHRIRSFGNRKMSSTGEEIYRERMEQEFKDTYTELEIAKLFIENNDEDMSFDDFKEILLIEYMEHRR